MYRERHQAFGFFMRWEWVTNNTDYQEKHGLLGLNGFAFEVWICLFLVL